MNRVLECKSLAVTYATGGRPVRDVTFHVAPGECFALVGGSGAGKSTIARVLTGLHRPGTTVTGELRLKGQDMINATAEDWRRVRGRDVGFVSQNPWDACDPLRPVRDHVAEAWRCQNLTPSWTHIAARLDALGVTNAAQRVRQYPHTWSGGMLQRAAITAATALDPPLIIADEPTSALDADRAQSVLEMLRALGGAVVLISHDVGLVLRNADRIGVLHDGALVETGTASKLQTDPHHPETRRLLGALAPLPKRQAKPATAPVLRLEKVAAHYENGRVHALTSADLAISAGEIIGIQGASGCGKSTLLRLVMGIERPSSGQILRAPQLIRKAAIQPIFQDPVSSLVPHWPIWRSVVEPLTAPHEPRLSRTALQTRADAALASVGLSEIDPLARPSELSVGQCQRAAIARATIARPALITADEPTSALDSPSTHRVSLLLRQAAERGTAVLIVSHDQTLLKRLADRIVIMEAGRTLTATPLSGVAMASPDADHR